MKRIVIILLIAFLSSATFDSFAQKIKFDKIESDGYRHIGAGDKEESLEKATYKFSLTVFANRYRKSYYLLVSSLYTIDNDCIILLKLGNDEVSYLTINNVNHSQIDWPSAQPIIGSNGLSWAYGTQKADYYVGLFTLTDEVLQEIETYGIKKLRIKFYSKYFEKSWKKDKLGKYLKKCHDNIEKQLLVPIQQSEYSKSIFEDF